MNVIRVGVKTWRSVAGRDSSLENYLRARRRKHIKELRGNDFVQRSGQGFVELRSKKDPEPRRGILLRGGCDLPSMFVSARFIRTDLRGSLAILSSGRGTEVGSHRSDLILQTLETIPEEHAAEAMKWLRIGPGFFSPKLFTDRDFVVEQLPDAPRYPKSVVVLSIGSDLVRTVYRHKVHGYLVDPGGAWLTQLNDRVMPDPEVARWFMNNFQSIGRIPLEEFVSNFEKIIKLIKTQAGAEIIVYNTLVVDPLSPIYNYAESPKNHVIRRREFDVALKELSAQHDFHVLDIDRILKQQGIRHQVDFAHFPVSQMGAIGWEAYRILKDLEVV